MIIQWFGAVWAGTSLVGLLGVALVVVIALRRVRRADGPAGTLLVLAAAFEGLALAGELVVAITASLLMRSWEPGVDAGLVLRDAWSLLRPLLHGLAMVCVALAAKRMTQRV
ncbi:MAG: hypothetical protein ABIO70_05100 [Pseudomonadota bacterium]